MVGLLILLNVVGMLRVVCTEDTLSTTAITFMTPQTSTVKSSTKQPALTSHGNNVFILPTFSVSTSKHSSTPASSQFGLGASVSVSPDDTNGTIISKSYTSDGEFKSSILAAQNFFRKQHNARDLKWNSTSAIFAASYAAKCTFKHSGHPTGENLAAGYTNVTTAVNVWGLEREIYNYDAPGFSEATGHFSQLVWISTTTVGCGRYACDGKGGTSGYFIVCEYYPPGNVNGKYATEVQDQIKGAIDQGYGDESGGSSGYGWLIAILCGLFANIVFVVMLVWNLS